MCSKINDRVKTCLFTCRRLSFLIYLHLIYSVSRVVLSDHTDDNWHHHFDGFIKEWVSDFGQLIMTQTSSLHVVTYFTGATALKGFTGWHHERTKWEIWTETKLNLNHLSIIAGFFFAQASACSCWSSNTPEPLPRWFPEKTSCVSVRLSIKTHWAVYTELEVWHAAPILTHFLWCSQIYKLTYDINIFQRP